MEKKGLYGLSNRNSWTEIGGRLKQISVGYEKGYGVGNYDNVYSREKYPY